MWSQFGIMMICLYLNSSDFSRIIVKDCTKQEKKDCYLKKKRIFAPKGRFRLRTSAIEASFIALGLASVVRQKSAKKDIEKPLKADKNEQIQIPN